MSSGVERPRRKNALLAVLRVVGRRSARGGGATCLRSADGPGRVDRVVVVPGAPVDRPRIPSTCRRSGGSGATSEVVARPGGGAGARGRRLGSGSTSNAMSAGARAAARARRAGRPASEYLRLSRARVHYGTARRNRLLEGSKLGVGSDVRPSNVADGSRVAGQGRGRSKYLLLSQRFTRNSYTVGLDFGLRTLGAATRRPSTALNGCTRSLTTARPRG